MALWLGLVVALFSSLGALRADLLGGDEVFFEAARSAEKLGWRLTHLLSADPAANAILLRHLQNRAPLRSLDEGLIGPASWTRGAEARQLAAAGWRVFTLADSDTPPAPRMEIRDAAGALVWSGAYPPEELRLAGATIWDRALLARIVAGETPPPTVPIGCAPPAGSPRPLLVALRDLLPPLGRDTAVSTFP